MNTIKTGNLVKVNSSNKITLSSLFNLIDFSFIYDIVPGKRKKVGRHRIDPVKIFQGLLFQVFTSASLRDLETIIGIDHSTFSKKRKKWQSQGIFKKIFRYLVKQLIELHIIKAITIAGDSTIIKSFSNVIKDKSQREYGAGWARKKGQGYRQYGFKVHALCDTRTELPIALIISGANQYDGSYLIPLLEDFKKYYPKLSVRYVTADKAYDDEDILKWIFKTLKAKSSIPTKDNRTLGSRKRTRKYRALRTRIKKRRVAVERMYSRGKSFCSLSFSKMKGKARITAHVLISFSLMLIVALGAYLLKARHLMRSFSWLSCYAF